MSFKVWKVFLFKELNLIILYLWNFVKSKITRQIDTRGNKIKSSTGGYYIPRMKVYPGGLLCPNCGEVEWTAESPFYKPPPKPEVSSQQQQIPILEYLWQLHGKNKNNKDKKTAEEKKK